MKFKKRKGRNLTRTLSEETVAIPRKLRRRLSLNEVDSKSPGTKKQKKKFKLPNQKGRTKLTKSAGQMTESSMSDEEFPQSRHRRATSVSVSVAVKSAGSSPENVKPTFTKKDRRKISNDVQQDDGIAAVLDHKHVDRRSANGRINSEPKSSFKRKQQKVRESPPQSLSVPGARDLCNPPTISVALPTPERPRKQSNVPKNKAGTKKDITGKQKDT